MRNMLMHMCICMYMFDMSMNMNTRTKHWRHIGGNAHTKTVLAQRSLQGLGVSAQSPTSEKVAQKSPRPERVTNRRGMRGRLPSTPSMPCARAAHMVHPASRDFFAAHSVAIHQWSCTCRFFVGCTQQPYGMQLFLSSSFLSGWAGCSRSSRGAWIPPLDAFRLAAQPNRPADFLFETRTDHVRVTLLEHVHALPQYLRLSRRRPRSSAASLLQPHQRPEMCGTARTRLYVVHHAT